MDDFPAFDPGAQFPKMSVRPEPFSEGDDDILRVVIGRANSPFCWQHGLRVLLLDEDAGIWSVAELQFDPATCRYVEIRRAAYDLEREAIGALLSRTLASGFEEVARASSLLNDWLVRNFGHTIDESRSRPRIGYR
ncbi:MAG: hypothetical protein KF883_07690 [Thermomicrobiales bacterium]|nr:hypothetical protein [Thermomicrobiales bacterium]